MRFRMRRISPKVLMVLAILIFGVFIRVGYAFLSQDLTIGGLALASKNVWGISFAEDSIVEDTAHLDSCENTSECSKVLQRPTIAQNGKSINFGISFHEKDEYYEFTVDIVNNGTIDAMLDEIVKDGLSENSNYLDFTVTYSDGMPIAQYDQLLKNGGRETLKVKVKCKSDLEEDLNTNLGITANYVQANNNMQSRSYDPETMIRSLNTLNTSIADDDPDNNLRFIGANPDNYVSFNNQTWRIIGVFDGRLKLIQESIGNYVWDTSKRDVNDSWGVNQWGPSGTYTGADLMKLLNPGYETNTDLKCNKKVELSFSDMSYNCGNNSDSQYSTGLVNNSLYWNASSGICYTFANYDISSCDFTSTGLSDADSKSMIDNVTWYLGSSDAEENPLTTGTATASLLYNVERSNNSGKQCTGGKLCTDTIDRTLTWQGKVGLIYPSDYVYATGGGNTYNRNDCLTNYAGEYSTNYIGWNNTYAECGDNDWLGSEDRNIFTIAPISSTTNASYVFILKEKYLSSSMTSARVYGVRPTVYLKQGVVFTNEGNGKQATPFVLRDLSNVHTVTFDANGGAIEPTSTQVDAGSNIGTLPTPMAPTGKTFDGWYTASTGGTKITTSYIPTTNVTVYAHWLQVYDPEIRIRSLNTLNTSIADDDPDGNLRFIGANPNNYVSFNNQTWRIIGVFDGKLKIIQDSIGNYSFDSSSLTTNGGGGINVWGPTTNKTDGSVYTGADLMKLLNPGYESNTDLKCVGTISGDNCGENSTNDYEMSLVNNSLYWNASSGFCYIGGNYQASSCDFSSTGLKTATARNMVENATWYLGSNSYSEDPFNVRYLTLSASYLYNIERSNNAGNDCEYNDYCSDNLNGITSWQGKVGLMYPSDYAYATGGGNTYNRNKCLGISNKYNFYGDDTWADYTDCIYNDWLFNSGSKVVSITPRTMIYSTSTYIINNDGSITSLIAKNNSSVRPTVYLKTSVKIVGAGTGTQDNPFKLKIIE